MLRNILNYGLNLDPITENTFLKTELITSRFRINDPVQLDVHIAISSYLSKVPFIFKHIIHEKDPFEYLSYSVDERLLLQDTKLFEYNEILLQTDEDYRIDYIFILDHNKLN